MLSLEVFINNKIKSYIPPEKKGVPRGKSIGFPREKYNASLLLLTMDSLRKIAKTVNSPYGSLRNWKTEKEFNELTYKHAEEFTEIFIKNFYKRIKKRHHEINKILKKPLEKIAKFPMIKLDVKDLRDIKNYSKYLSTTIFEKLFVQFLAFVMHLFSKLGMEKTEISMYLDAFLSGKDMNKYIAEQRWDKKYFDYKAVEDFDIKLIAVMDEIVKVLGMLYNIKMKNKANEFEMLSFNMVQVLQLSVVQGILLHKKTIKEKDRKLAIFLLSRAMPTSK